MTFARAVRLSLLLSLLLSLVLVGCRARRLQDGADAAPSTSARSQAPLEWTYEGSTEILYRGRTDTQVRHLLGVRPAEHKALVHIEGRNVGHARFDPARYLVVDYQAGQVTEERELTSSELRCVKDTSKLAESIRWSTLVHSFGLVASDVTPEPAFSLSNDGKHIAYKPCTPGVAFVLAEADGQKPRSIGESGDLIRPVGRFSPDGRYFAWMDRTLHAIDTSSGVVRDLESKHFVTHWRWAPDSSRIYAVTSDPSPLAPREVCVTAHAAPAFDKAQKVFCLGALKAPSIEISQDGRNIVLIGQDVDRTDVVTWAELPSGTVKRSGPMPDVAYGLLPLSRTPPLLVGLAMTGVGIATKEWLALRDAESGRTGVIRWKAPVMCTYNQKPRWLDDRRILMLCQGVSNEAGFSPEYQLVAADVAKSLAPRAP